MRRSKRKKKVLTAVLAVLTLLLAVLLTASLLLNSRLRQQYGRREAAWNARMEEYQQETDRLETQVADLEEQLAKLQESQAEQEAREAAASAVLESIQEYPAGELLEEDQLDQGALEKYFTASEIQEGDAVYQRIIGKSYRENPNIGLEELRYLKMPHYNFDGQIQVGEMIVHADIAQDVLDIFRELFLQQYQIQSMYLVDNYWTGDGNTTDTASIEVNNTSAFNYRPITGGSSLSNHAFGRAIDINPQQNPYVHYDSSGNPSWSHENANDYIDRSSGMPHMITHEDPCYQIFSEYGFTWGGDWNNPKDYQHFEKRS